ncbi:MAG: hypothetical protein PHX61_02710 [Alphaproteobacteria bacterium]|nr:hypothetical protein [Alphaproteobacteria bacterium]
MTAKIPNHIPPDGKIWRLKKESLEILRGYDSDPNTAIKIMKVRIETAPQHNGCNFDEKKLEKIVKDTMESVIAPFMGS